MLKKFSRYPQNNVMLLKNLFETRNKFKTLDWILIASILTLSWNGLSDRFTYATYVFTLLIAIKYFLSFGNLYKLAKVGPLIYTIALTTLFAISVGQSRINELNFIQNSNLLALILIKDQTNIYSPLIDLLPALKWILALVTIPYIIQITKTVNPKLFNSLTWAWILGVEVNVAIQYLQALGLLNIQAIAKNTLLFSGSRYPGLASHVNALAITICLTLPLLFLPTLKINSLKRIVIIVFFSISVYLTGSRAGLIVYLITLLNILMRNHNSERINIRRLTFAFFASAIGVIAGLIPFLISMTRLNSDDPSAELSDITRISLLHYGWQVFWHFPITGGGCAFIKISHNIYFQVLSSIGIIGFFFFIRLIYNLSYKNRCSSYIEKLPLIVFLFFGLFNNSLSDFYLYFPLGYSFYLENFNSRKNRVT